ncbi:hypothetical protein JMUB6875_48860 [Nocardia sp. JMUB6875]
MSTYGMAAVADTATREEGDAILAVLRGSPGFVADRCVVHPPVAVGNWWRTSWCTARLIFAEVGPELFDGVRAGRVVVADDWDEFGAEWTCWQIVDGISTPVYRKHLPAPSGSQIDTKPDIAGTVAATAMARLWDCDPARAVAVESRFDEMAAGLGSIGTPFMPWFDALNLSWPGGTSAKPAGTDSQSPGSTTPTPVLSREESARIREWARQNGFQVSARGRLTDEIIEAFGKRR